MQTLCNLCRVWTSDYDRNDYVCNYRAYCDQPTAFSGHVSNVRFNILLWAYADGVDSIPSGRSLIEIVSLSNYIQPYFVCHVSCY